MTSACGIMSQRMSRLLLLLWLMTLWSSCCQAQEPPTLFLDKFDYSKNFRTNVCDRQRAVFNNTLDMPMALSGLTLSVVVTNYTARENYALFSLDRNGRLPRDTPGLFIVMMDEVARRADFNWRDRFGVAKPLIPAEDGNKTWTDILLWGVESFDISLEKWGYSLGRVEQQISFPAGFWDSSIALVEMFEQGGKTVKEMSWIGFLQPFQNCMWGVIVAVVFITGLQFWGMEFITPDAGRVTLESRAFGSMYLAATCFTGHFGYQPKTNAGYLLSISFTMCALCTAIAYTANLASFLVAPSVAVFNYPNINVAVEKGARVCVQGNGVLQTLLNKSYPELSFSNQSSKELIFEELRQGGACDVAAHQNNAFRKFRQNKKVNHDCSLTSNGQFVKFIPAGMATKVDNGAPAGNCTSLISHVLDFHLSEMLLDGFVEKALDDFYSRTETIDCVESVATLSKPDEPIRLGLIDVGGSFLLHFILTCIALAIGVFNYLFRPQVDFVTEKAVDVTDFVTEKAFDVTEKAIHVTKKVKARAMSMSFSIASSFMNSDSSESEEFQLEPTKDEPKDAEAAAEASERRKSKRMSRINFDLGDEIYFPESVRLVEPAKQQSSDKVSVTSSMDEASL